MGEKLHSTRGIEHILHTHARHDEEGDGKLTLFPLLLLLFKTFFAVTPLNLLHFNSLSLVPREKLWQEGTRKTPRPKHCVQLSV